MGANVLAERVGGTPFANSIDMRTNPTPQLSYPSPYSDRPSFEEIVAEEEAAADALHLPYERDLEDWLSAQERMNETFPDEW